MKILNNKYEIGLLALIYSLISIDAYAQTCVANMSCETLGFTKSFTDCEGRLPLKCPFDKSKLFCENRRDCDIGDILYSNKTCSSKLVSGKTPIGVVFDKERRLAVALNEERAEWSENCFHISFSLNLSKNEAIEDFSGKNKTKQISDYCKAQGESCPVFETVNLYKTAGTKYYDWYLPAWGELNLIYQNRRIINITLKSIGKTLLCVNSSCGSYSSSTIYGNCDVWGQNFSDGNIYRIDKIGENIFRPVLAF